jgi:nicotinate-nucleotide pyrophosphorylase (carboxylating)
MSDRALLVGDGLLRRMATDFLAEDIPSFDVGAAVVGTRLSQANILVKSDLVIAGLPFAEAIFKHLHCTVQWMIKEGSRVSGSSSNRVAVGIASGPAHALMQAERTVLEILSRCSSCATYAALCVEQVRSAGWKGSVAATRKTTPGIFRAVEKYGALVGGADMHRYSLSSMVMLKDNHVDVVGGITIAVRSARRFCGFSTKVEVECRSLGDAVEAAEAGAEVVMLDNFQPKEAASAAETLKKTFPHLVIEVSGGITLENIDRFAVAGVDVISVGKITHGAPSKDISMKIQTKARI